MGWIIDITQCPRCGYKAAHKEKRPGSWQLYIICIRCGYSSERFYNSEKYESLKNDHKHKNDDHEELRVECWDWKVNYPTGSYICRRKGEDQFTVDSIEDDTIKKLLEHLDEYDACKYTFYQHRSWYIKDLLDNTTSLFSADEYHRITNGD